MVGTPIENLYKKASGIKSGAKKSYAFLCKSLACAGVLSILTLSPAQAGVNYNVVPYYNPDCNCCILVGTIMHEIFWGTGMWTAQDDFQNEFYTDELFTDKMLPAWKQIADEARNAIITNAMMIGAFLDGQATNAAISRMGKVNARTLNKYQPSDQICRFGTVSRSLAQSDDKSRKVRIGLMEQLQARQMMQKNTNSGFSGEDATTIGRSSDKKGRWKQYKEKFCDGEDMGGALGNSGASEKCLATSDVQLNRDIDFSRTLEVPKSLDIAFKSGAATLTNDEENIIALGSNLYAHDLPVNLGKSDILSLKSGAKDGQLQKLFAFRSIAAKRSVAANSFAAQAGMKSQGGSGVKSYLDTISKELGLTDANEIKRLIGDDPSYYTQMDFLAKRLYQSPNFYANLMDSPTNVARQSASMKAISLMQDRDIYESLQRSEMLLSTLMEMQVQRRQDKFAGKGAKE